jgi:class 3 adenylate cyclase
MSRRCPNCAADNPATMRFCGMCGAPLSETPARRERRRVTTVFIDLAGFSTLTRDFDPEKLRDLADDILTVVAGIIEEYDGYIDAFQGDGLIALFGAPNSHPNDPERAVLAAAEGLRAVEAIGQSKGYPLKGRAGVNTGLVIAGNLGAGKIKDYTVMGSAVNLAARLEAAATPGEVWVGPETYRATRHSLRYLPSPVLSLAGFPDITQVQRFVQEARQRDPYAHLSFVGREAELAALWRALDDARTRPSAQELWVVGEAGSGKTRLVREFSEAVEAQGAARPLWLELDHGGGPGAGRLQVLPGLSGSQDLLQELSSAAQPLLLIAEQGPQNSTLEPLIAVLKGAPVQLLLLRLSRRAPLAPASVLSLPPLGTDACLHILGELVDPALQLVTTALVGETGGNPAYTIELGRTLSNARTGAFSGSLTSLLQARLDMLPPPQRHLLAQLALVGERSWLGLAAQLAESSGADVGALLAEDFLLQEVDSSLPGETGLRFRSELLRRAALLMVPLSERPSLHRRVAGWLEAHISGDLASNSPASKDPSSKDLAELLEHHRHEGDATVTASPTAALGES